ncbi:Protein FAR1-RELATED SEQUENCE 11 [Bienertia sinuspersici]
MELQKNVKHGELPFLEKDIRNLFTKVKRILEVDDMKNLLEYMKSSKEENPLFQYAYTIDGENKMENLFWSHAKSFDWYQKYGDVVVFHTTYKVNAYDMPCGIFVGVDNHGKTIMFGCALLRNETTTTFKWLMKTFVGIMKKSPKTIITDQDPWMSEAIAVEMPSTKHSFCIWHITSKFSSWFVALLRDNYQAWCQDFYLLYKMTDPNEFEENWPLIVGKYDLQDNKHIQGLYKIRFFWAPAYLHEHFFGGMVTTGRSESINAFIKRFVSSNISLTEFVEQVDIGIEDINQQHIHLNLTASLRPTSLKTKSPLEEQVFGMFTPYAFKKFQQELTRATLYSLIHMEGDEFMVRYYKGEDKRSHKFWGILCRHILRVLFHEDCFKIPSSYLPLRWCCDALQAATTTTQEVVVEEILSLEEIIPHSNASIGEVLHPPQSKTKGRPKNKREKGGKEVARKQTKSCSICSQPGHTKPTCPHKENLCSGNDTNDGVSQKKQKKSSESLGLNPVFTLKV